ncbi:hypothetical protein LXG23DRAFT_37944 [Yarrowia lipolytica]|nr:hypothetical protein BKA90DRAFT_130786 [Yarrowia lipolytica]KAJ8053808.1 hypothetical protein LXG23DRAFT_37944 [Yarrowia lipolytica]
MALASSALSVLWRLALIASVDSLALAQAKWLLSLSGLSGSNGDHALIALKDLVALTLLSRRLALIASYHRTYRLFVRGIGSGSGISALALTCVALGIWTYDTRSSLDILWLYGAGKCSYCASDLLAYNGRLALIALWTYWLFALVCGSGFGTYCLKGLTGSGSGLLF